LNEIDSCTTAPFKALRARSALPVQRLQRQRAPIRVGSPDLDDGRIVADPAFLA